MTTTIQSLRTICETCETSQTNKWIGNYRFEARHLNQIQSQGARYGILENSQMVESGLMVIFPDALDGAEWKWEEILPGLVQSRATGGLSKFQCGFDPQQMKVRRQIKRQYTERMYIHRQECMLSYIGSTLQAGHNSGPVYIQNNESIESVAQGREFIIDLMLNDMRALSRAIDGCVLLGDWTGEDTGTVINGNVSLFPHFDGVIKQALVNASNTYYATVDVVLPAVGAGAYFVKWYGDWTAALTDVASVISTINTLKVSATGEMPYTATQMVVDGGNTTLRITANDPEADAYGQGAIEIYYSATGSVTDCDDFITGTVIQNPMPWSEEPLLFNYSQVTEADFFEYFKDVYKAIRRKMIKRFENGLMADPNGLGRNYVAIDPLVYNEKDFAYLREIVRNSTSMDETRIERIESMLPEFVPVKVLEGTGLWMWTYQSNIIYMTNAADPSLGTTSIWYDEDCQEVKSRNEIVGNVLVADFNMVATNAKNSPFEAGLHSPYRPEQLPHFCPDVRSNCATPINSGQFKVYADVTFTPDGSDYDLNLDDASVLPEGSAIASVVWTVYQADGTTSVPGSQVANATITVADTVFDAITIITYKVTLDTGETETITIPKEDFLQV
jgi:hypothetical protein